MFSLRNVLSVCLLAVLAFIVPNSAEARQPIRNAFRNVVNNARHRQHHGQPAPVANVCTAAKNTTVAVARFILPPYERNETQRHVESVRRVEHSVCVNCQPVTASPKVETNAAPVTTPKAEPKKESDAPTLEPGTKAKRELKISVTAGGEINVLICEGNACQTVAVTIEETTKGNFLLVRK